MPTSKAQLLSWRLYNNLTFRPYTFSKILKKGDVNWPARSTDLTPSDFFLWGFKEEVFKTTEGNSKKSSVKYRQKHWHQRFFENVSNFVVDTSSTCFTRYIRKCC